MTYYGYSIHKLLDIRTSSLHFNFTAGQLIKELKTNIDIFPLLFIFMN